MAYKDKLVQKEYQRIWMAARRAEYFANKMCAKCGSIEKLELHHIDRLLKISNAIWSWRIERRLEELAKCQILCNSCHKLETRLQIMTTAHGTRTLYTNGCRCNLCRENHRLYVANWRKKKKARLSQLEEESVLKTA